MLQKIGDTLKGHTWLTYVLFGALALIFAAWGAYGIANLNFGGSTSAAKVNGQTISIEEVRQAWQQQASQWQQRYGSDIPDPIKARMEDQLLETFVRTALMTQRAHDLGYRVSDSQLLEAVHEEPAFQLDGKYSPEVAKARLQQAGITPEAFEADLRSGLQRAQLGNSIRESEFLTPAELRRVASLENEERQVRYVMLPIDKFAGSAPIDDAAIQAYYEQHKSQFMTAETVHLQYAELKLDQVAAQTQLSDADLHDYYDKNKAHYVLPERRRARHILIQSGKDDGAALKKAQEVLAKVKAGGDFAALAKQYSQDEGSAGQGGELGWLDRTTFPGAFADTLFSMSINDIRGPAKSDFGYHIIQLEGIEPEKAKTFDEARTEIESQLRHDRAADRFGDVQEQIQTKLEQASGIGLDALAKEFGMQLGEVPAYVRGAGGGELGASPELQQIAFSDPVLAEHRVGGPVLLGEDRLVLVRALEHHPPAPKPLAEVRDSIIAAIRKDRGTKGAIEAAQAAAKRLVGGASFDEVVGNLGVTAEPAHFTGRNDPSVPAQIRQETFASPKPSPQHPIFRAFPMSTGGAALLAVTDARTDAAANPQLQAASRRQDANQQGDLEAGEYLEQLRLNAKVQKNPQVFEQ
jgi:peptidyl-prolyl cis-trans isomerase D